MKGNDLSNSPTYRYWVVSDVVLDVEVEERPKPWWKFGKNSTEVNRTVPNLAVLSKLWKWSSNVGVRLELVFVEEFQAVHAVETWDLLEKTSSNPFSDWMAFETYSDMSGVLPFRPDLLGIIDIPNRVGIYGGRGMTVGQIP